MDSLDKKIILEFSGDIEFESDFIGRIARKLNIDSTELLERLSKMQIKGELKRIAPILRHRNTDYKHNGMAVFVVKEEDMEYFTKDLKENDNISHVYERETDRNWPYNVYGMTHGKSREEVEDIVSRIAEKFNIGEFKILYSTREFKKTSPDMEYLL